MLYLVERTESHDYGEYDAVVVRAASEKEALEMVCREEVYGSKNQYRDPVFCGFRTDGSNAKVTKIKTTGYAGVICASFNAG